MDSDDNMMSGALPPTTSTTHSALESSNPPNMAYLIYPPDSPADANPTYILHHLDCIDEVIFQDLQKWDWRIDEHDHQSSEWLGAVQEYHRRMRMGEQESEAPTPSLWEFWRQESARRIKEDRKERRGKPNKLVKRVRPEVAARHKRKNWREFMGEGAVYDIDTDKAEETNMQKLTAVRTDDNVKGSNTSSKVEHEGEEESTESRATQSSPTQEPTIFQYGNDTSVDCPTQLDAELLQEIRDWAGNGILKTTQVSVTSEVGVAVDERGEVVHFPPKWDLGLFPWEEPTSPNTLSDTSSQSGDWQGLGLK